MTEPDPTGVSIAQSARLFFRGPVWWAASILSLVATLVGVFLGDLWPWLCLGLAFIVVGTFSSFHRDRKRHATDLASLPRQIDDQLREGMELLRELSEPVKPKEVKPGVWDVPLSAPRDRWEKAESFEQRGRDLLTARDPALLTDYADGFNEKFREVREAHSKSDPDPEDDRRDDAEKMRLFAERQHMWPAVWVEASLEGLAAARLRLR
ncbi:MAG: hypothetical protein M9964_00485 [Solirubrobacterales bacterium]|nr:hypothetical protein [Thermoleophilales bacterium]MCO5325530.1 hypothetical protein [Solirubrobacterales bacterium]